MPTTFKQCSIPDCPSKQFSRTWCRSHWKRWREYGDPLAGPPIVRQRQPCAVELDDGSICGEPYSAGFGTSETVDGQRRSLSIPMCAEHYAEKQALLGRKMGDYQCENHPERPARNWANEDQTAGWCTSCFDRFKLHGDPLMVVRNRLPSKDGANVLTDEEALDRWVDKSGGPNACWLWTDTCTPNGYGKVRGAGRSGVYAHVLAYATWGGSIPDGYQVDHLCHNRELWCDPNDCDHRRCCNPAHLEPVTGTENLRRAGRRRHARKAWLKEHAPTT